MKLILRLIGLKMSILRVDAAIINPKTVKPNLYPTIMLSSSIQATLSGRFGNSEYGRSKKAGEELFFDYAQETGAKVAVYRFPNLMGHSRPKYNSAVRNSDQPTKADYFDRSFNWLDFRWGYEHSRIKPEKPHDFEKMIEIAEKLSQNMKHVRIDLYYCANKIYFGEITFFDGSGFDKIEPVEWDYRIGSWIEL